MINWKGYGRKQSCPNLKYFPSIYLEGMSKTTEDLSRIAGLQDLLNKKQEC
jgi:hypothetical protein